MSSAELIIPHLEQLAFVGGFFAGMIIVFLGVIVFRQR